MLSPARESDVVLDTADSVVRLLRPAAPTQFQFDSCTPPSPIVDDIAVCNIPDGEAEEQLSTFHRAFISSCPVVYLPPAMTAIKLRLEKPFLWLVVMALTAKVVSKQFSLADVFWKIVSQRVISEHHASMDLLQGIICFASWCVVNPPCVSNHDRHYCAEKN